MHKLRVSAAAMFGLFVAVQAFAAGQASPEDAKAMAIKAAEYLKTAGAERALSEFSAKDGPGTTATFT